MSTVLVDSKAERIAQARKKLRDYQAKHHGNTDDNSSPSQSNTSLTNNGRHSAASLRLSNHDDKRSPFERIRRASQSSVSSVALSGVIVDEPKKLMQGAEMNGVVVNEDLVASDETSMRSNGVADVKRDEYERVVNELAKCSEEKKQLSTQYAELTKHYSEIYAAYAKLSENLKTENPVDSALQVQLLHLQTAMSVVVQEKTSLQQKLRETKEQAERLQREMRNIEINSNEKTSQIFAFENEIASLNKEVGRLNEIVQRQSDELEDCRKEATAWQARVLRIQQDRNDAQERLRSCMKEAEAAYAELEEAKKQLKMKDLYVRQLDAYSPENANREHDFQNLHDENGRLKEELNRIKADSERFRKEAQTAREHYESYGTELNQNVLQLSTKLEQLSREKMSLQEELQNMEVRLEAQKNRIVELSADRSPSMTTAPEEGVKMQTASSESERMKQLVQTNEALRNENAIKDKELKEMTAGFNVLKVELSIKMAELETIKNALTKAHLDAEERQRYTEDALSLSEQLQNEKATVSRAIAQNRELKEQLIELQDKLVSVTQESLDREDSRLSALHLVSQLQNELCHLKSEANIHSQNEEMSHSHEKPRVDNKETRMSADFPQGRALGVDSQECDETNSTLPASECNDCDTLLSRTEEARARVEAELTKSKLAYEQLSMEHRRVAQENYELRRIMEQNSEDENQNNIHVELGQALERINDLSAENEQLRNEVAEHRNAMQPNIRNGALTPDVPRSSSASLPDSPEPKQLETPPPLEEKPLAWTELEARFARAMRQNADLIEANERLEHIVMQLSTENDTIGDYVTIYHHQRKMMNERIHERENAVAKLSLEKEQMQQKLNELQSSLLNVLTKKGIIQMNALGPNFHGIHGMLRSTQGRSRENLNSVVGVGWRQIDPNSSASSFEDVSNKGPSTNNGNAPSQENTLSPEDESDDDEVGVRRVLNLISELQNLERARSLPPFDPNMHCAECRGKMINL